MQYSAVPKNEVKVVLPIFYFTTFDKPKSIKTNFEKYGLHIMFGCFISPWTMWSRCMILKEDDKSLRFF